MMADERPNPLKLPSITLGAGRKRPQGGCAGLSEDVAPVEAMRTALQDAGAEVEGWWSPHLWAGDYRKADRWLGAHGAALDLDYVDPTLPRGKQHTTAAAEAWAALAQAANDGDLPASNLVHSTPRGARIVLVWSRPCTDKIEQLCAQRAAARQIEAHLERDGILCHNPTAGRVRAGFEVDGQPLADLGRFFFTPAAIVDGIRRNAPVLLASIDPIDPGELAKELPVAEIAEIAERFRAPVEAAPRSAEVSSYQTAVEAWNDEHPMDISRSGGTCPMCGHTGCFGQLPENPAKWACFSANHQADSGGVGREMDGYVDSGCGDALDFEAWKRGCKPSEVLRTDGYLAVDPGVRIDIGALASGSSPSNEAAKQDTSAPEPYAITIEGLREAAARRRPPAIVEGLLHEEEIGVLFGQPGCGKSFVAQALAASVAVGQPWLGQAVPPAGAQVLYIAGEGGYGIWKRVRAWHGGEVPEDSPLWQRWRQIVDLVPFLEPVAFRHLVEALKREAEQPRLIVIDTLALAMAGGDENSAKDMGVFVHRCKQLRDATGAAVLLVHHSGKSGESERGSSALRGACDVMLSLEAKDDGYVELTSAKVKDGKPLEPLQIDLVEVDLGDGETSLRAQQFDAVNRPATSVVAQKTIGGRLKVIEALKTVPDGCWIGRTELQTSCGFKSREQLRKILRDLQREGIALVRSVGRSTEAQLRPDWEGSQ